MLNSYKISGVLNGKYILGAGLTDCRARFTITSQQIESHPLGTY